jgi:hypothetical protein
VVEAVLAAVVLSASAPFIEAPLARLTETRGRSEGLGEEGTPLTTYQHVSVQRVEVSDGRTRVSVEVNSPTSSAGTWPMRVFIDNSLGLAGTVTLSFRGNAQGFHTVTRSVELQAGERRTVSIPVFADLRSGTLSASGAGTRGGEAQVYFANTYGNNKLVLSLGKPESYERFVGKSPDYSGGSAVQVLSVPPAEAPSELAAYSGFDAVVLPEAGLLETLDEAQRRALEAYAATGGTLLLQGPLRSTKALPLYDEHATGGAYGFGVVQVHLEGEKLRAARELIAVNPRGPAPEYERRYNNARLEALLPQATAPLGRFLIIIGLFTLAIGPGSLFVARRRGPAMLLVTIPSTAFVTCAVIIGYSILADGFAVHSSTVSFTLLDGLEHRAMTVGVTGYYANLSPPRASFEANTVLVPVHEQGREHFAADLTWKDGLTMGSDFIPSRTYREWGVLSLTPTRARVQVRREGGAPVFQNALGHPVARVTVKLDGDLWAAFGVVDGGQKALTLVKPTATLFEPSSQLTERFSPEMMQLMQRPLDDGEFMVLLSDPGFVPSGNLKTEAHDDQSWVRGSVER